MSTTLDGEFLEPSETAAAERKSLRGRLLSKLTSEGEHDLAERLAKCGAVVRLVCTCCGDLRDVESRCDLKWCPSCQHALATETGLRYLSAVELALWPLRVTLTVENFDYSDTAAMRKFRRSMAKVIRQKWFRRAVAGGVTGYEITDLGNGFHIHAHVLCDCEWFSISVLPPTRLELARLAPAGRAEMWKETGRRACAEVAGRLTETFERPASVKVERVKRRGGRGLAEALRESLKYSTKGTDLVRKAVRAGRVIWQLDSTRMVTSFGSFFGRPEVKKQTSAPRPCDQCGAVGALLPAAVADMMSGGRLGTEERQKRARKFRPS